MERYPTKLCLHCRQRYVPKSGNQKYCPNCREVGRLAWVHSQRVWQVPHVLICASESCKTSFTTLRPDKVYCSDKCGKRIRDKRRNISGTGLRAVRYRRLTSEERDRLYATNKRSSDKARANLTDSYIRQSLMGLNTDKHAGAKQRGNLRLPFPYSKDIPAELIEAKRLHLQLTRFIKEKQK